MIGKMLKTSVQVIKGTLSSITGTAGAFGIGVGLGTLYTGKKAMNMLEQGTPISNPIVPMKGTAKAYGKRGIDANRMNTNGLVQSLHGNRRKF